mgnify:CR=1 FL=1
MYLFIILLILIIDYIIELAVDLRTVKSLKREVPSSFKDFYPQKKYEKSQNYTKDKIKFSIFTTSFNTLLMIIFILIGGFNIFDQFARGFGFSAKITGLIFSFSLVGASFLLSIPFSAYQNFVIEEKYGFNKMTAKIFITDLIKSALLSVIMGIPILYAVLTFFYKFPDFGWLYIWVFLTIVQIVLVYIAPRVIMPLFNKFSPLEDEELKEKIFKYAAEHNFKIKGIYKMDGSKRSSKANAYFTGLGSTKRIVLFDTLLQHHTNNEILTILAHEMGHFKNKHILKNFLISFLNSGLMLFILNLFLKNEQLFNAFKMENVSIYASLILFGFLYSPISTIISILTNALSRKFELEADRFAVETTNMKADFIKALKRLSAKNLSNLTPPKIKIILKFSHPPVIKRIKNIEQMR